MEGFVLSVPSGLVEKKDVNEGNSVFFAACREVSEEIGLLFEKDKDSIQEINPLLYCSPGLTDESTAVVKLELHRNTFPKVSTNGAVGDEIFKEITWITKEQAREFLRQGRDHQGMYYSAITWIALMIFVSDIW